MPELTADENLVASLKWERDELLTACYRLIMASQIIDPVDLRQKRLQEAFGKLQETVKSVEVQMGMSPEERVAYAKKAL